MSAPENTDDSAIERPDHNGEADARKISVTLGKDDALKIISSVLNSSREKEPAQKAKIYNYVFVINDDILKELDNRAREKLEELPSFPETRAEFSAWVGMPDLSRQKFDDFDRFMRRAGDKTNPERLELQWTKNLGEPFFGAKAKISVTFITERPLENSELGAFEFHTASINLHISGQTDEWVEKTFSDLEPFVTTARLGGMYYPLYLFKDKYTINILSNSISFGMMLVGEHYIYDFLHKTKTQSKEELVSSILNMSNIGEKIDLLAK